jgi:hypothetical protein
VAVSASALWVNFDVYKTVTMTMNDLPGAVLSPVDRRRSQPHFLRLTTDLPSEPLNLDGETERIVRAGGEVLRAPGFVVKRLGCCGQEFAHVVDTDLVTADPSHEGNVVRMRPQFKVRPRVTAGVLPEGVMAPLDELTELGSVCIRSTCCRLHNFSFSCTNTAPAHRSGQRPARPPARARRLPAHGADPNLRDPRHHPTPLDECQPQNQYPGSPAHDEVEAILWPLTLNGDTQTSQPPGSNPRTQTHPPGAITPDPV